MQAPGAQDTPYALVVDDNPVILLHVTDFLSDAGFSVLAAADSDTAMDWLAEHESKIKLLFTNIDIPGPLNGFGLAQFVASQWPHIGVVAASGHVEPWRGELPEKAVFVPKPFTEAQLLDGVRQALLDTVAIMSVDTPAIDDAAEHPSVARSGSEWDFQRSSTVNGGNVIVTNNASSV